jgi:hypothetical protein
MVKLYLHSPIFISLNILQGVMIPEPFASNLFAQDHAVHLPCILAAKRKTSGYHTNWWSPSPTTLSCSTLHIGIEINHRQYKPEGQMNPLPEAL